MSINFKNYLDQYTNKNIEAVVETEESEKPLEVNVTESEPKEEKVDEKITKSEDKPREKKAEKTVQENKSRKGSSDKSLQREKQLNEQINMLIEDRKTILETQEKLIEAISVLTEKIESIRNIEVPPPVVHVTMPEKKVTRELVRDDKGFVTHIVESVTEDKPEQKKTKKRGEK